jgi:FixJ family two-component response regulator
MRSVGLRAQAFVSARELLSRAHADDCAACLLLDVELPDLNGVELRRELNAMSALVSVIFISGHGDIAMTVSALKAGALDSVTPVADTALVSIPRGTPAPRLESAREPYRTRFDPRQS